MADEHDDPSVDLSTTWVWEHRKIRAAPEAKGRVRAQRGPLALLDVWPRRKRMHLTVTYRGGPEAWYEIRARGVTIRRPGTMALHDLISALARWDPQVPPPS